MYQNLYNIPLCIYPQVSIYMADDMHIPLSEEVKNAFIKHSTLQDNIMDRPFFHGKTKGDFSLKKGSLVF